MLKKSFILTLTAMAVTNMTNALDIVSLADLIIDHQIHLPDETINRYTSVKFSYESITKDKAKEIISRERGKIHSHPGGSATNTLTALSQLGHECRVIGKLGKGPISNLYKDKMSHYGIDIIHSDSETEDTGQSFCLINPEGRRSMLTYLGAASQMQLGDLNPYDVGQPNIVHVEGYSLCNLPLLKKMLSIAKAKGAKISMDLGAFMLVKKFKPELQNYLKEYIDIVFANIREARALTGIEDPQLAALELSKETEIAVVHMSEKGGIVANCGEFFEYKAFKVKKCVDCTGAGDLFAAGFLHGYLRGDSLKTCARFGAACGAAIVQVEGAQLPQEFIEKLKEGEIYTSGFETNDL